MFEIGNTLREARTRQGLDIRECEDATKIRGKYLRAMEEERFDALPSPAYVRGFLRSYAEFLDLDGRLVLDEYDHRFGGAPAEEADAQSLTPTRDTSIRPRRPGRRRSEAQLAWLAIGGVTGVALLVWLGVGQNGSSPPAAVPETTEAEQAEAPPPQPPPATTAAAEAPPPAPEQVSISLVATPGTDGSWIEVRARNEAGPVLFEGTLAGGDARSFEVGRSIWLRTGNAASLSVSVDGEPEELTELTGNYIIARSGARLVSAG